MVAGIVRTTDVYISTIVRIIIFSLAILNLFIVIDIAIKFEFFEITNVKSFED